MIGGFLISSTINGFIDNRPTKRYKMYRLVVFHVTFHKSASLSTLYLCCTYVVVASLRAKHSDPNLFLERTGKSDRGEKGATQISSMPFEERKGDEGECKFGEAKAEEHKHGGEAARSNTNSSGGMRARLELVNVDCGPTDCPVEERLELSMEFTLDRPLQHASWEIKFLVDSVHERHVVRLGATKPEDYPRGISSMHFEVPRVSVSGIKPCTLANTALLVATLTCTDEGESVINEIATVNLVVQVADTGQGSLTRCIYSPLE